MTLNCNDGVYYVKNNVSMLSGVYGSIIGFYKRKDNCGCMRVTEYNRICVQYKYFAMSNIKETQFLFLNI